MAKIKNKEDWLKKTVEDISQKVVSDEFNKFGHFRQVTKSLVIDALKALEETRAEWEIDHNSTELREEFHLLYHYLDYLKRFCEGKV